MLSKLKIVLTKIKSWSKIGRSLNNKKGKKKMTNKAKATEIDGIKIEGIWKKRFTGILYVFVYASIGYMIALILNGTDTMTPKLLTIPAGLWVAYHAGRKLIG